MKLILIRHGETEENKRGECQGHRDTKLNAEGIKQAKLLAKRLKDVKIDICYSSDLKRASETAEIILKEHKNTKLIIDKRLRERKFGEYEGQQLNDVFKKLVKDNEAMKPPGGESFNDVRARVKSVYEEILKTKNDKTILFVSHGATIILLIGIIMKKNFRETNDIIGRMSNTAVSEIDINNNGEYNICCINCKKHL